MRACPHCGGDFDAPPDDVIETADLRDLWEAVRVETGVRPAFVLGDSRRPDIVAARQVAVAAARELFDLSYPQLGRIFNRDHSTMRHANNRATIHRAAMIERVCERWRLMLDPAVPA